MFKKLFCSILLISLSLSAHASDKASNIASDISADRTLVRMVTSKGNIELELDKVKAPESVNNFLQYAKDGFYNGTVFHRVIRGFMIQGGGFTTELERKQTRQPIQNEAFNQLKNERGTIAMARTNAPHSATSQFFINTVNNKPLNFTRKSMNGWGYAVFGKVTKGMDVVDSIERSPTGAKGIFGRDVPLEDIVIEKVEIISE